MSRRSARVDHDGVFSGSRVERAIIDIGSNTVRLVVYGGAARAPTVLFNEKVAARLGRDIAETGRLAQEAMDLAMRGLRRYTLLLREWRIDRIDVVATAAVREASNGPDFLKQVGDLGLAPRLLTGKDEARISAVGVIGAFPGTNGIVADLGGGSLELIHFADGVPGEGTSRPLGTLRLRNHRGSDAAETRANLGHQIGDLPFATDRGDDLYLVGGTWRAMAVVAMTAQNYPLSDPHGFALPLAEVRALMKQLARLTNDQLKENPRITAMRADYLPDAGLLLGALLDRLEPDRVVFSSWGLREGVLFDELEPFTKTQDPLLAGVGEFANSRGTPPILATRIAAWTLAASLNGLPDAPTAPHCGSERLRLSATMLALASMQIEPNLRTALAMDWALQKRWIDVDPAGRAMLAATVAANKNECDLPASLHELASDRQLEEGICWGLAIRLCRRLGGRSHALLNVSELRVEEARLVLQLERDHADLFGLPSEKDLQLLADRMGLSGELQLFDSRDGGSDGV